MRIGIISLSHESNTFISAATALEDFRRKALLIGGQIIERFRGGHHEISGFIDGLEKYGAEIAPIFVAAATPGGTIDAATYDALLTKMCDELKLAGRLDGLLVAPHGAAVSESEPDVDGHWLWRLREIVGPDMPIVGTLDPHANVSQRMIDATDALVAYRTNPHLDQKARGVEAAELLIRTIRGETKPTQAAALPPITINIERQLTSASPCRELYALADEILKRRGVLSDSVILGFPYADVAEMGSGFIVVTDNDGALAQECANELAEYLIAHRQEFVGELIGVNEAIELALKSPAPVCLLDMGDNIGGGTPGDGTILAQALHERRIDRSFVALFDPEAVKQAGHAGADKTIAMRVGGNSHTPSPGTPGEGGGEGSVAAARNSRSQKNPHPALSRRTGRGEDERPLEIRATVVSFHDGRFTETQARHGGMSQYDMGPTAIVRTEYGMTVQLMSRRTPPVSLGQLTSCGIDPKSMRIIVAKGVHAPVAAYSPVCATMIRVNTPGVTTADMTALKFVKRRRPMFPFEDKGIEQWAKRSRFA